PKEAMEEHINMDEEFQEYDGIVSPFHKPINRYHRYHKKRNDEAHIYFKVLLFRQHTSYPIEAFCPEHLFEKYYKRYNGPFSNPMELLIFSARMVKRTVTIMEDDIVSKSSKHLFEIKDIRKGEIC
ncbi:MAG: hypothetical protein V3U02_05770, partial [Calditrichia bacterium]